MARLDTIAESHTDAEATLLSIQQNQETRRQPALVKMSLPKKDNPEGLAILEVTVRDAVTNETTTKRLEISVALLIQNPAMLKKWIESNDPALQDANAALPEFKATGMVISILNEDGTVADIQSPPQRELAPQKYMTDDERKELRREQLLAAAKRMAPGTERAA